MLCEMILPLPLLKVACETTLALASVTVEGVAESQSTLSTALSGQRIQLRREPTASSILFGRAPCRHKREIEDRQKERRAGRLTERRWTMAEDHSHSLPARDASDSLTSISRRFWIAVGNVFGPVLLQYGAIFAELE